MNFTDFALSPEIAKAVSDLGFKTPQPIQELMIPHLLADGGDTVGLAHTGTGKTAAFGLPLIEATDIEKRYPQVLILCPTRELCIQITKELALYGKHTRGLAITSIYGGDSYERQIRELKRGSHFIVATPGRLIDLLQKGRADISEISNLVLDEADIMLNMGFKEELDAILESAPSERRTILLSATMPNEVARIAKTYMQNPIELSVGKKNTGPQAVEHRFYTVRKRDKYQALKRIVDFHPDLYGIVFCRTRASTQEVAAKMVQDGYNAEALHGDLSQSQREHVMSKFRSGTVRMLFATDIAARGLDVEALTHVIHYDLPTEADIYTHRSGRTGRAGKSGISVALISDIERRRIRWIERVVGQKFTEAKIPGKREIIEQQLIKLTSRVRSVEVDDDQISSFLPLIEESFADLSRDELIKRFVSLEFNKLLDYYHGLDDIRPVSKDSRSFPEKHDRGKRDRKRTVGKSGKPDGYDWLEINLGRNNQVLPLTIIGLVNQGMKHRNVRLGRIDIGSSKSWVQVESDSTRAVEQALRDTPFKGRRLIVQRAAASPGRSRKSA